MSGTPGFPQHWSVITWNADHLLAVDLTRREEKVRFILRLALQKMYPLPLFNKQGYLPKFSG